MLDWRSFHLAARDGDLARVQKILNHRFGISTFDIGNPRGADITEESTMFTAETSCSSDGNTVTAEVSDFVNSRDSSGKSALHEACAHGHAEIARLLLSLGALPSARKANGFTPLLCAAAGGHAECARLLLAHMRAGESAREISGAESAGKGAEGSGERGRASAWRAADRCGENALHLAARAGAEEVVDMLLDAAEREDKHVGSSGETPGGEGEKNEEGVRGSGTSASPTSISAPDSPLASYSYPTASLMAVSCHTRSAICPLVNGERQSHFFVNARTRNGRTPLHSACLHGHVAVCELLLKHGANPTARDSSGSEPIHEAAAGGHVAVIHLLAAGSTAPGLASLGTQTSTNTHAETDSNAQLSRPDEICDFDTELPPADFKIRDASAAMSLVDVNTRDASGATPFHCAAAAGHVDAMRALSQHGADLDPVDNAGTTPLYWAASRGHVAAVEWLLEQQEQEHLKVLQEGTAGGGRGDDSRCSKDRGSSKRSALHVAVGYEGEDGGGVGDVRAAVAAAEVVAASPSSAAMPKVPDSPDFAKYIGFKDKRGGSRSTKSMRSTSSTRSSISSAQLDVREAAAKASAAVANPVIAQQVQAALNNEAPINAVSELQSQQQSQQLQQQEAEAQNQQQALRRRLGPTALKAFPAPDALLTASPSGGKKVSAFRQAAIARHLQSVSAVGAVGSPNSNPAVLRGDSPSKTAVANHRLAAAIAAASRGTSGTGSSPSPAQIAAAASAATRLAKRHSADPERSGADSAGANSAGSAGGSTGGSGSSAGKGVPWELTRSKTGDSGGSAHGEEGTREVPARSAGMGMGWGMGMADADDGGAAIARRKTADHLHSMRNAREAERSMQSQRFPSSRSTMTGGDMMPVSLEELCSGEIDEGLSDTDEFGASDTDGDDLIEGLILPLEGHAVPEQDTRGMTRTRSLGNLESALEAAVAADLAVLPFDATKTSSTGGGSGELRTAGSGVANARGGQHELNTLKSATRRASIAGSAVTAASTALAARGKGWGVSLLHARETLGGSGSFDLDRLANKRVDFGGAQGLGTQTGGMTRMKEGGNVVKSGELDRFPSTQASEAGVSPGGASVGSGGGDSGRLSSLSASASGGSGLELYSPYPAGGNPTEIATGLSSSGGSLGTEAFSGGLDPYGVAAVPLPVPTLSPRPSSSGGDRPAGAAGRRRDGGMGGGGVGGLEASGLGAGGGVPVVVKAEKGAEGRGNAEKMVLRCPVTGAEVNMGDGDNKGHSHGSAHAGGSGSLGGSGSMSGSSGRSGGSVRGVSAGAAKGGRSGEVGAEKRGSAGGGGVEVMGKVIAAVVEAHSLFFTDETPNGTKICDHLLAALLNLTQSPMGVIASVLHRHDGSPYLKTHAATNVAWTPELHQWCLANYASGLVFTNMKSLLGASIASRQPYISNHPHSDPQSSGTPPGHPTINSFLSVPVFMGTELVGVWMVANKEGGYNEDLVHATEPLSATMGQILFGISKRKRRMEAKSKLYEGRVPAAGESRLVVDALGTVTACNREASKLFCMPILAPPPTTPLAAAPPLAAAGAPAGAAAAAADEAVYPLAEPVAFPDLFYNINCREDFMLLGVDAHLDKSCWSMARQRTGKTILALVRITKQNLPTGAAFICSVWEMIPPEYAKLLRGTQ
ncbi:unnamed protein product [Closterium sp. Yama58-4]|nr:unnamed protein product [Closterium sp. Yama58-4]